MSILTITVLGQFYSWISRTPSPTTDIVLETTTKALWIVKQIFMVRWMALSCSRLFSYIGHKHGSNKVTYIKSYTHMYNSHRHKISQAFSNWFGNKRIPTYATQIPTNKHTQQDLWDAQHRVNFILTMRLHFWLELSKCLCCFHFIGK